MPAEFLRGDLFATALPAYAHGCNCAGGMGAGIAVEFRRRWPRMFEEYRQRCADKRFVLGDVFVWTEGEATIFNLGTQEHWKKKAQLPALARAVKKMVKVAEETGIARIGLPRIGAGFGGLDWPKVRALLETVGEATPVMLTVFESYVPRDVGAT